MPPAATMPDIEAITIANMIVDGVTAGRVYGEFPDGPTYPLVIVQRIGGPPVIKEWLDGAALQVDGWGDTKAGARDAGAAAMASMVGMSGFIDAGGGRTGVVTGVRQGVGLRWLPDENTDRPRYRGTMTVYAHP